jgi:FAD/FMN-containing dehydrogenase
MSTISISLHPVTAPLSWLAGQLVRPGDQDYDQARQAWNLAVDQRPAAVILPESAADVAAAVSYAAEGGLRIAAQGTGHNASPLGPVNDTIRTVPVPALSHIHMDPEQPVPGAGDGLLLDRVPAEAIDAFTAAAGAGAAFPLVSVELRHLGGEMARPRPGSGALSSVDAEYALFAVGMAPAPELVAAVRAQIEVVKDALAPWAARQMYLNFTETRHHAASFWTEQAYHQLRRIKAAVDPGDLIRANHPIPPAR